MNDFELYLKEINFTKEQLKDWMTYMDKYYYIETLSNIYYKSKSPINGWGLFAVDNIKKDNVIGKASIKDKRTTLARFTNHSNDPNIFLKKVKEDVIGFALKDINKNEELLVNYRHEGM